MIQQIGTRDLQIGMFIELPHAWWEHPFARGSFLITSDALLNRVKQFYDGDVAVDLDRSELAQAARPPDGCASEPPPGEPAPAVTELADSICAALSDAILTPVECANEVYSESRDLMRHILEQPTTQNIRAAKAAIGEIVDVIIADEDTADNLLSVSRHDYCTYTHSVNVGVYAVTLASRLYHGSAAHDLREMGAAFFLHDLGKTRIDPAIINKRGKLNEQETRIMQTHPLHSFDILQETGTATEECRLIALQHHERVDGSGYPLGLRGDEIHEYARICSITDVYDALVSRRSYKAPMTPFEALSIMRRDMLGHFERSMFESFVCMFARQRAA